ncbi:MAG: hypothetical protein NUV97_03240 [archaeon]|nr:hypothetical protein [archaeon]
MSKLLVKKVIITHTPKIFKAIFQKHFMVRYRTIQDDGRRYYSPADSHGDYSVHPSMRQAPIRNYRAEYLK